MDHPQWNLFQPPISDSSSVLDYNPHFCNHSVADSFPSQNHSRYNGYFEQPTNPPQPRNNKPPNSSNMPPSVPYSSSSQYSNSSGSSYFSQSQMYNRGSENQQSSHMSSFYGNTNSSSSSQYNSSSSSITDFKIGTFTLNASGYPCESNSSHESMNSSGSQSGHNTYQPSSGGGATSQSARETGIIEKLLQTYGFIQCCERQARLFFHFSQFDGNTEHLRIGDPVEFEVTFDRRTGKPIASSVTKISPEVVLSEERVMGIVTTELKSETSGEHQGRITYENRGECFFLPYGKEDVEGYVTLKPGDRVSFQIATDQRGNLAARHVRLENLVEPVKYQGVVSAIKDSYGFIERADVVDEIFFHFSEVKTIPEGLKLGDDVEFLIQTRNSKEVATNMVRLPPGTVVFEDINSEEIRGQVLKPVEKTLKQNQKDPLSGRIRYRGKDRSEVEVKFGERDQRADFTLRHGDWVKFNIATDRRDNLQKATNISLLDESFSVSGEKREEGIVCALKDGFGFIKCADRDARMFFRYNELLEPQKEISIGEEVDFTVTADPTAPPPSRQSAIRIRRLTAGTVKFEVKLQEGLEGEVTLEPLAPPSSPNYDNLESAVQPGNIIFYLDSIKQMINYYPVDGHQMPHLGDRVEFTMYLIKRTKEKVAMEIRILPQLITTINPSSGVCGRQNMVGSGRTFDRGSTNMSTLTNAPASPMNEVPFRCRSNTVNYAQDNTYNQPATSLVESNCLPYTPFQETTNLTLPVIESHQEVPPDNSNNTVCNSINYINSSDNSNSTECEDQEEEVVIESSSSSSEEELPKTLTNSHEKINSNVTGSSSSVSSRPLPIHHGFLATLKDTFGFIETVNHDKEIFFHFSNVDGNINDLDIGQEVEYTVATRTGSGGKLSAENVRCLPVGTLATPKILGEVYEGCVLRSMRSVNPDQAEYCGEVCLGKEEEKLGRHQFGITGLVNKKELLQPGDLVNFQLDEDGWAVNIRAVRKKLIATVEAVKGQYGFLNYETEEGKKLFFHQSEVKDGITLNPGDEVQFVIITNLKTGKSSACNIMRVLSSSGPSQRPDRLVSRLKNLSKDTSKPRIEVIRQPRGPDGTTGFKVKRCNSDNSF